MTGSNIYVSVAKERPHGSEDQSGYRRARHTWLISIEPHKRFIPFVPRHKIEPLHYTAIRSDESESWAISDHPTEGIFGAILVANGTKSDAGKVRELLVQNMSSTTSGSSSLPSEQCAEDAPDRWLRRALHVLQDHHLTSCFDVGEFMTFAHSYAAKRADGQGPAMAAYPGLHKDREVRRKNNTFWISRPHATHPDRKTGSSKYGGLM